VYSKFFFSLPALTFIVCPRVSFLLEIGNWQRLLKKIPFFLLSSFALLERTTAPRALAVRENETAVLVVRAVMVIATLAGHCSSSSSRLIYKIQSNYNNSMSLFCLRVTKHKILLIKEIFFSTKKNTKKERCGVERRKKRY
jgi:hypothetical protein